jgi:predicted transcriptional regulator of viral defense system
MSVEINNSRQTVTTMAANTQVQRVLELVRQRGIVRGTELDRLGVHRMYLKRLVDRGLLVQRSRGIYEAAKPRISEHDSVIEVAVRVPRATLCLLTALRLHQLTTQNPFEVWIMIDRKARKPSMTYPPIRVVRASGFALSRGVNAMRIDGVEINVTTVAKTVADCFKYRSTVGVDVAIEALRDAWRQKKVTVEAIIAAAKIDRVATVMRPYLESLV